MAQVARRVAACLPVVFAASTTAFGCRVEDDPTASTRTALTPTISLVFTTSSAPQRLDDPTRELLGIIGGPLRLGGAPGISDATAQLQDIGIRSIRNNDSYDDRLDITGIFNCQHPFSSADYPTCRNSHSGTEEQYPCWEGTKCTALTPENYAWTKSDELFDATVAGGFEPFLRFGASWSTMAGGGYDFAGPESLQERNNVVGAAPRFFAHYAARTDNLKYLDLWTEKGPPGDHFWSSTDANFQSFWVDLYKEVDSSLTGYKIGGPGFAEVIVQKEILPGAGHAIGTSAIDLLQALKDAGIHPGWIGYHVFSREPLDHLRAHAAMRDLLRGDGIWSNANLSWKSDGWFAGTELILDAFGVHKPSLSDLEACTLEGIDTADKSDSINDCLDHRIPGGREPLNEGGAGAAALTGAWISAANASWVKRTYVYRSMPKRPGADYGVLKANGDPKPRANAIRLWSRMVNEFPALLAGGASTVPTEDGIWTLAGMKVIHGVRTNALLIANPNDDARQFDFRVDGALQTTFKTVKVFTVDDTNQGRTPVTYASWSAPQSLTIGPQSVMLVVESDS